VVAHFTVEIDDTSLGHADVVVYQGVTLLYTSLDGLKRSRFKLMWR